jgi:hypothetical protein
MDWNTALRKELKRFNAKAKRELAKAKTAQPTEASSVSKPSTWTDAFRRILRRVRRKAHRLQKETTPEAKALTKSTE